MRASEAMKQGVKQEANVSVVTTLARLFIGLVSLTLTSALQAQHESRNLSGIVSDRHHEPLRGAVVQAQNLYTKSIVSYITGRNGQYSFKRLDGDCDYKISAAWHDQRSSTKNLSLFDGSRSKVIDLTIKSGSQ